MKKIIKIIITLVVISCIVALVLNVKITNVDVVGNEKISDMEIAKYIFSNSYDNISIVLYLKDKFKEKKKIPLVSKYEIKWQTPFSIVIDVIENPIIGFIRRDIKNVYFDKNGNICEVSNERKDDVIEVIGISFKSGETGDRIELSNERLLNAILNISSYLKENNLKASLIEIKEDETVRVYIENIEVNLGDIQNMEIKLQRLRDIYPKIAEYKGVLDLKDAKDNMLDEQYIFKLN